ncbi:aldo/keto reductase [Sphingomonas sediminicola]|uniref:Aldo/keto reductase n=1 Tax=Sphingomonas sediminicola TaxID=386874 RepID=A0ABX6T8X2_9SPHN|nr:aldo/keto reductase [Sphingomonas sediminicola]
MIRHALDLGITFFDGAGVTGGVDQLLSEGLGDRRNAILLSTKIHLGPDPAPFSDMLLANKASSWVARRFGLVCSAATVRRRVEQTLKAIRTDRVDLLHLHAVSPRQYPKAAATILPELRRMKDEGKIRAIGITEGFLTDPGHETLRAAVRDAGIDAIMVGFNVENHSAADLVLPRAEQAGIAAIGMFALRGLLNSGIAEDLKRIAMEARISSLSELAYRFSRHQAGMDVILTGTGDPEHLEKNIAAVLAPPLPAEVLDRLRALTA